jgi:hypothetical protein
VTSPRLDVMADNVADDDADLAGAEIEHIEPVATDLLIGLPGHVSRRHVQAGDDRQVWQETALQVSASRRSLRYRRRAASRRRAA